MSMPWIWIFHLFAEMYFKFQVFLEYADIESSSKARAGMNGRKFGGKEVVATFYQENMYAEGLYDG